MPIAMRRWCGSGAPPGSEICSKAMPLLSQGFQTVVDVLCKTLDEHEGSDLLRRSGVVALIIERCLEPLQSGTTMVGHLLDQRLDVIDRLCLVQRLAPRHLLHEEFGRHRG